MESTCIEEWVGLLPDGTSNRQLCASTSSHRSVGRARGRPSPTPSASLGGDSRTPSHGPTMAHTKLLPHARSARSRPLHCTLARSTVVMARRPPEATRSASARVEAAARRGSGVPAARSPHGAQSLPRAAQPSFVSGSVHHFSRNRLCSTSFSSRHTVPRRFVERRAHLAKQHSSSKKTERERKEGGYRFCRLAAAGARRGRGQAGCGWDPSRNDKSPTPDPAHRGLVYAYPGSFRPPDTDGGDL